MKTWEQGQGRVQGLVRGSADRDMARFCAWVHILQLSRRWTRWLNEAEALRSAILFFYFKMFFFFLHVSAKCWNIILAGKNVRLHVFCKSRWTGGHTHTSTRSRKLSESPANPASPEPSVFYATLSCHVWKRLESLAGLSFGLPACWLTILPIF